jgi:hypothetical protein
LDNTRSKDLKTAAQEIDPELAKVIKALKGENELLGETIGDNLGGIEIDLIAVARLAHDVPASNSDATKTTDASGLAKPAPSGPQEAQAFFAVVAGRQLLHSDIAIAPSTGVGGPKGPIDYHAVDFAKAANETLDAVLNGNRAIANLGEAGIYAAAIDIAERAKDARDFASSLTSK